MRANTYQNARNFSKTYNLKPESSLINKKNNYSNIQNYEISNLKNEDYLIKLQYIYTLPLNVKVF